jgi:hypothetical protein
MAKDEDNFEFACGIVLLDRRDINEVANCLQISHDSVYEIIETDLGFLRPVQDRSQNNSQYTNTLGYMSATFVLLW